MQSTPKLWSQSAPEVEVCTIQASIIELQTKVKRFKLLGTNAAKNNLPGLF
jgi:hypothetical protein